MPLTNAEKQQRHRERLKAQLATPVMQQMESYLESKAQWLRNRAIDDLSKGREINFRQWKSGGYSCYEAVGYVTDRIDESVFLYMRLKGWLVQIDDIPRHWNMNIYRLEVQS